MNTENNKIIAEFMGGLKNGESSLSLQNDEIWLPIRGVCHLGNSGKVLKYHSDWDWLMEVVEKIETIRYKKNEIQFKITKYAVCIQAIHPFDGVINPCVFSKWGTYGGKEKLKATYKTVVQFIEWYNEQK